MDKFQMVLVMLAFLLGGCSIPQIDQSLPLSTDPTHTPEPKFTPSIIPSPTENEPTSNPTPGTVEPTQPVRKSLFLISWDAARADLVYEMMSSGKLPNFANLANHGMYAEYAQSVDPSLTAPAHASLATGCFPARTGIVSNAFHNPYDSFYWYRVGFDEPLAGAEPVWVTASEAGLTSAVLFFPGGTPELPMQTADYTVAYGVEDAYSRLVNIEMKPVEGEWGGEPPDTYSPAYEGSFTIPEVARIYVYLYDRSDDGLANYDSVLLNSWRAVEPAVTPLGINDWGSMLLIPSIQAGAHTLIKDIMLEGDKPVVSIYHSGVNHNNASPRELLDKINQNYGFPPAEADSYALEHGWISEDDYLQMIDRVSTWRASVSSWVYNEYQPDLLMTWQNNFDSAGHAFMLRDPRQPNYTTELVAAYEDYYLQAAQSADQALDIMLDVIDLERTALLMVSDHGMAPIHTKVYVNTILEKAGLLKLDRNNYVVVDQSKAFAVASGGSVNVYINLVDYQRDGIVTVEEYPEIQGQIYEMFSSLTDPQTGDPIFSRVLTRQDLDSVHLNHLHSGDVFAQAQAGYDLDGWRGANDIFGTVDYYGQHGYDCTLLEMRGVFIAVGAAIPNNGERIQPVNLVDIAPTIAKYLEFNPDPRVDGTPVQAIFDD